MTAAEAIAVEDLEVAKRLAAEFEALGGGVLTMALAQGPNHGARVGGPLDQPRGNLGGPHGHCRRGGRSCRRGGRRRGSCHRRGSFRRRGGRRRGGRRGGAADALGARTALAPELPKEPGCGADDKAEDAEEIPGRPMFSVGSREESKNRGGSLSSEGANAAVQAERSTQIEVLRSLEYSSALVMNTASKLGPHTQTDRGTCPGVGL